MRHHLINELTRKIRNTPIGSQHLLYPCENSSTCTQVAEANQCHGKPANDHNNDREYINRCNRPEATANCPETRANRDKSDGKI